MLKTPLTTLRAPVDADLDFLVGVRNDVELQLMLASRPRPNTPARVREWVARVSGDDRSVLFVIADTTTGAPRGYVQLVGMDFVSGHGSLGICLDENARGRGYAKDALALLGAYVREVFGLRKIVLDVLAHNSRAIAFYEKCGFSRVGTLRRHFLRGGVHHDVLVMEQFVDGT